MDFQGKSFLAEKNFSQQELQFLIDYSQHLKKLKQQGIPHHYLEGKNIALLFEKTSTRTRAAFTVAANDLGAHPEFLGSQDIQLGKKESVADTAKILGSMFDGIEFRGFSQQTVEELAENAGVPVWNGLTDLWHPTQMIADFLTIQENFGRLKGVKLVYCGDGRNNVANSLLVTAAILGTNITIAAPDSLQPDKGTVDLAQSFAEKSGTKIEITADIHTAVKDADVLYTDVWVSMGEEGYFAERIKLLQPYQINQTLIDQSNNKDLIVLHCLPAFHDTDTLYGKKIADQYGIKEMEITDEVFQGPHGRQFQQGENRMHSIKAIMAATLGNLFLG